MSLTKKVEILWKEVTEYFYEVRGIIKSGFDTTKFKFYDTEIHSMSIDRGAFIQRFCYDVFRNLENYKNRLIFISNYLSYVNNGKVTAEEADFNHTYLLNCNHLAYTEITIFMEEIKPLIGDYKGAHANPRKKQGRPKTAIKKSLLTQIESAKIFLALSNVSALPKMSISGLANFMQGVTGFHEQNNRTSMSYEITLTSAQKKNIKNLLRKAIKEIDNF